MWIKTEDEPIPAYRQNNKTFRLLLQFHEYYGYEPYGNDNICVMAIWDSTNECFFEKETRLRIRNEDIYMWWKNEQTLV